MVRPSKRAFDATAFLSRVGPGRSIAKFSRKKTIYSQGSSCESIYYVRKGRVRLTVLSRQGKMATIAILSPGEFFGETCLGGQSVRMESATALTDCEVFRITKRAMVRALSTRKSFAELFVAHLLSRNIRYQEDLTNHLFNTSEKRLARVLLQLSQFGKDAKSEKIVPKISQKTLAQMVGTTRERVSFFMNKFRKLGLIDYNGGLLVHSSLINVVLHE